jgi:purine-binding chemotaxis protein CheW
MTGPGLRGQLRLLTVTTGGETFGIPIARVQTTFRIEAITPIPLGPRVVLGLVNLRGAIIPAISLRRRLDMPEAAVPIGALAVGLDSGADAFALLVDEVGDVIAVEPGAALPLPPHIAEDRAAVTLAFYHLASGLLPVLDVSALLPFGAIVPKGAMGRSASTPLALSGGIASGVIA